MDGGFCLAGGFGWKRQEVVSEIWGLEGRGEGGVGLFPLFAFCRHGGESLCLGCVPDDQQ